MKTYNIAVQIQFYERIRLWQYRRRIQVRARTLPHYSIRQQIIEKS
jgi:hypothetical protein